MKHCGTQRLETERLILRRFVIELEALKAVVDFLFDEVGANRVEAYHDPHNPNSGGVMKKS